MLSMPTITPGTKCLGEVVAATLLSARSQVPLSEGTTIENVMNDPQQLPPSTEENQETQTNGNSTNQTQNETNQANFTRRRPKTSLQRILPMVRSHTGQLIFDNNMTQRNATLLTQARTTRSTQNSTSSTQATPNNRCNTLKFLQINLHSSHKATTQATQFIAEENIQIAVLQDVYLDPNTKKPTGLCSQWQSFSSKGSAVSAKNGANSTIITNTNTTPIELSKGESHIAVLLETEELNLTIINLYARPNTDITNTLQEISGIINRAKGDILITGDFNAHSTTWGYEDTDSRGEEVLSFLLTHGLATVNTLGAPPSFVSYDKEGWPDLTIANRTLTPKITNWEVLTLESLSDHRYITFEANLKDPQTRLHRLNTSRGKHKKFTSIAIKILDETSLKLDNCNNHKVLDEITNKLLEQLTWAAEKCYKKKNSYFNSTPKQPSWWSPELKTQRSKVSALRRLYQSETDKAIKTKRLINYKRERARYQKSISIAKSSAWKKFCTKTNDNFGPLFKIATGKFSQQTQLANVLPEYRTLTMRRLQEKFLDTLFITRDPKPARNINTPKVSPHTPTNYAELNRLLKVVNVKKAPGIDLLDYTLIKRIFYRKPQNLIKYYNKCLELNYFPKALKTARVVLFLKPGKPPKNPKSYRPICLLPTLGKLLEKILYGRIYHNLQKNNYWHKKQYGFKDKISTENAVEDLLKELEQQRKDKKLTALISIDISGAFDSLDWSSIKTKLKASPLPQYLKNLIATYLLDRSIQITENGITTHRQTFGGCPQGSCLGPLLWNLEADEALALSWPHYAQVQAYADDFTVTVSAENETTLVIRIKQILHKFNAWTQREKLKINWEKTQVLYYNRPLHPGGLGVMPNVYLPPITIANKQLQDVDQIKYLGLVIHKNHRWEAHCDQQIEKARNLINYISRTSSKTWGVQAKILKIWYLTVAEKILTYAAPVWGLKVDKKGKDKLTSCQRQFLKAIANTYKTAPTSGLCVLTGIIPINIKLAYEATRGRVSRLNIEQTLYGKTYDPSKYSAKAGKYDVHPAQLTTINLTNKEQTIEIYTDGSKTPSGTASAFAAFREGIEFHSWSSTHKPENSVFQAEMQAIIEALTWVNELKLNFRINTDSQSSISALISPFSANAQVHKALKLITEAGSLFHINWVRAHIGIEGNERADQLAKEATLKATDNAIPWPISYLKKQLSRAALAEWQYRWSNAKDGRHTYKFLPTVTTNRLKCDFYHNQTLTGHGPFPAYLKRFKKWKTDQCYCGTVGSWYHYLTQCHQIKDKLLKPPATGHHNHWYKSIAENKWLIKKVVKIQFWLMSHIDEMGALMDAVVVPTTSNARTNNAQAGPSSPRTSNPNPSNVQTRNRRSTRGQDQT